jgi:hypothetical protein
MRSKSNKWTCAIVFYDKASATTASKKKDFENKSSEKEKIRSFGWRRFFSSPEMETDKEFAANRFLIPPFFSPTKWRPICYFVF